MPTLSMEKPMSIQEIPLAKLRHSKKNARKKKPSAEYLKWLSANILAQGVLQNLVAIPKDDCYGVIAGGRRLSALQLLVKDGKISSDYLVPVKISDESEATAISLAENFQREEMHPVDSFEAFYALKENMSEKDIAHDFGVKVKFVKQRLKLAVTHPTLRNECRAGNMSLDCLMAFTLSDDTERQLQTWDAVKNHHSPTPHKIKQLLTEGAVSSSNKLALYVGQADYKKAGGAVTADLFAENQYFEDADLLRTLALKKLECESNKLEGWKWVEFQLESDWSFIHRCNVIELVPSEETNLLIPQLEAKKQQLSKLDEEDDLSQEQQVKYDKLEQEIDEFDDSIEASKVPAEEDKQYSGCFIYLDNDGKLQRHTGLIHPDDIKLYQLKDQTPEEAAEEQKQQKQQEQQESETIKFSNALTDDLWCHRVAITKLHLAQNFELTFDLMIYEMTIGLLRSELGHNASSALSLRTDNTFSESSREDVGSSEPHQELMKLLTESLGKLPKNQTGQELFTSIQGLAQNAKQQLFAQLVSMMLLRPYRQNENNLYQTIETNLSVTIREHWCPTSDNLFKRVDKEILSTWGETVMTDQWSSENQKLARKDMAAILEKYFTDTNDNLPEEKREFRDSWLPECMI